MRESSASGSVLAQHPSSAAVVLVVTLTLIGSVIPICGISEQAEAESLPDWEVLLYLHEGLPSTTGDYDWLNTSDPQNPSDLDYDFDGEIGVTIRKNLPSQRWRHFWVLDPPVNSAVNIVGDVGVRIWAANNVNVSASMTVILSDMAPSDWGDPDVWAEVGSATVGLTSPYTSFRAYDFAITGVDYVLDPGHRLVVTIIRADSDNDRLFVVYDTNAYNSYILLPASDFISVDEAWTEDPTGEPANVFSELEDVVVQANVSDPFGSYDISGAEFEVRHYSNESLHIGRTAMTPVATDPSVPSSWRTYTSTISGLYNDTFIITVFANDAAGSPSWFNVTVTVVAVDHFSVECPVSVTVMHEFTMAVTVLDADDDVISNWRGIVNLEDYLQDGVTPGPGSLSVQQIQFDGSENGQMILTDQSYDFSETTLLIKAVFCAHDGWSSPLQVFSGPVDSIVMAPSGPLEMMSGESEAFTVSGYDSNGLENTSWNPAWSVFGGLGTVMGEGFAATFNAAVAGSGSVNCTDATTGTTASVSVTVTPNELVRIVLSPAGPLTIHEGESQVVTALGYDAYDNALPLDSAIWSTNTSGVVSGSGSSITYRAGYVPEIGVLEVSMWGVSATLWITVTNALNGPWLSTIPRQISTEDSSWSLSLSSYWHHTNGTEGLRWFTEGVNSSLYLISHDPSSDSIVKFLTQPDKYGSDVFRLWVRDSDGFSTYQDIEVSIQPVNDRPRFVHNPPTEVYVKFDTSYLFDYTFYVSDVDDSKSELLMFASSSYYGSIMFDGLVSTYLFGMKDGMNGYWEVMKVTLTDAAQASSSDTTNSDYLNVVVWVTDDTPPSLNDSLPDRTIHEGDMDVELFDLDDYFYDLDFDYLVYRYGFENVVIEINQSTHQVFASAPFEWSGVTEGTFTAVDPDGAFKTDVVAITVIAVNDAPSVDEIEPIHVRYDTATTIDAGMYVIDPDHSLEELSFEFDSPFVNFSSGVIVLQFPANISGGAYTDPYIVEVTMVVTDPMDASGSGWFTVLVSDNYVPVLASPLPYPNLLSFPEDSYLNNSVRLDTLFCDVDDDELTYFVKRKSDSPNKIFVTIYPDSVVNFTAEVNWSGYEILTFVAYDEHGAWTSWTVTVTVTPVNDAPVIMPIPDMVLKGWPRNSHFLIVQFIGDSETSFYQLVLHASPEAHVSPVGCYIYVSLPDDSDVISVTLYATDEEGARSNTITFMVGVSQTVAEQIGWPYTFPLVLLAAGIASYFAAMRLPRPYELENLFLIHNDGRLIAHVTRQENTNIDKDVVSAMFTAVQEFVRDSFQAGEVGLKKLEIGDKNVMIEKGDHIYTAMIYSGWPGKEVFSQLTMLLRDIEERYETRIERWNGTLKSVKGVEQMLQDFMSNKFKPGSWVAEDALGEEEWVDMLDKEA